MTDIPTRLEGAATHPAEQDARKAVAALDEALIYIEQLGENIERNDIDMHLDAVERPFSFAQTMRGRFLSICIPLTQAAPDGWRPIETAPKDGTKFDGWQRDERVTDMYWSDIQEAWCIDGTYGPEEPTPLAIYPPVTHWMPPPPAPPAQGAGG